MKVYTAVQAGHIGLAKIKLAAELSGTPLDVQVTGKDDQSTEHLPAVELPNGQRLFSANAAVKYLMSDAGSPEQEAAVDQWLEWEATALQPVLHPYLSGVKGDYLGGLQSLLKKLEETLKGKQHVTGDSLTAADVVVWSAVLPALHLGSAAAGLCSDFPAVTSWSQNLQNQKAFKSAAADLLKEKQLKAALQVQPATHSAAVSTKQLLSKGAAVDSTKQEQPQASESVTVTISDEEKQGAKDAWFTGKVAPPRERKKPILPQDGEKNILITSALPYVNNVPHLGNIIGCVLSGDVFARFCRLRNLCTLYICGTDEYGTATETKALEEGLTPKQICDKYHTLHAEIYDWFNIQFDHFGRTTTIQQTEAAQDIFWKLHERGYILKDSLEQLQCQNCDRFLADRFVEGICPFCSYEDARGDQCDLCGKLINAIELKQPRCKVCSQTPVVKSSQHLFLDLQKLEPLLTKHLDKEFEKGHWSSNAKVITRSWIRDGLKQRCISRDLKWGTPVPLEGYTDKVFYVWYDAPIGYISITANYTEDWKKWWFNPEQVELYQFIGKDNVPFHSVIFPACQLGTGDKYTVVNHLSATEYLNYEDGKFSKSRGVGVFGSDAKNTGIPTDIWRFYLLYLRPESQDSAFNWEDFAMKNNSELLNNLGNFINRALMFVWNNFDGKIPDLEITDTELELLALVTRELKAYIDSLTKLKMRDGIRNILSISRLGNQYMQAMKPWVLVKGTDTEKAQAGTVVGMAANLACLLSSLIQPYMPVVSETIRNQVNAPPETKVIPDIVTSFLPTGHKINKPSPLFQKIEASLIQDLKKKFAGKPPSGDAKDKKKGGKGKPAAGGNKASGANQQEIDRLTAEVTAQGNVVRQLKAAKAGKDEISREVTKLLDLKKQLSALGVDTSNPSGKDKKKQDKKGNQPAAPPSGPSTNQAAANPAEVERLTAEVTKQGDAVRQLKTSKADKASIDNAVAKLLDLKKQLAEAQGVDPSTLIGGGKKKKGKK